MDSWLKNVLNVAVGKNDQNTFGILFEKESALVALLFRFGGHARVGAALPGVMGRNRDDDSAYRALGSVAKML